MGDAFKALVPLYLFMLTPLWIPLIAVSSSYVFGAAARVVRVPVEGAHRKS